jgi:hypothetical protein
MSNLRRVLSMRGYKSLWRELAVDARKIGVGGYILVASLLALLAAVIEVANRGWSAGAGTDVPSFGYAAMAAGILFPWYLELD